MAQPTPKAQTGFSLIEIIVVVAIIGILGAIGAIAYGQWQHGQAETAVKNDLKSAAQAMEKAKQIVKRYPHGIPLSFEASDGVEVTYASGNSARYCLNGTSAKVGDVKYYIQSSNAGELLKGACPAN